MQMLNSPCQLKFKFSPRNELISQEYEPMKVCLFMIIHKSTTIGAMPTCSTVVKCTHVNIAEHLLVYSNGWTTQTA